MSLSMQPSLNWPHYGIGFGAAKRAFLKGVRFDGRASRGEYWWFALFTVLMLFVLGIPTFVLGMTTSRTVETRQARRGAVTHPARSLLAGDHLPSISLTVRRLHDAGYCGWLVLLNLVPYVGY